MTALLEFKQRLQALFGKYEIYIMPLVRFAIALTYFLWINTNMGYMTQLNSPFVLLVLSLVCSILPPSVTAAAGFVLMVGHGYALSLEVAGFLLVMIILMGVFFLRFAPGYSIVLVLTPLSFAFGIPVMLPIGTGLLGSAVAAIPAGLGVILYYFVRFVYSQSSVLANTDVEVVDKLKLLADGIMLNWGMWISIVAFIVVILLVHLIRTRMFDYAWRAAIVAGGLVYILIMLVGSYFLNATVSMQYLLISTVIAMIVGLVLEFTAFGADYARTERLQFEDDDYYYFVKAVPKASVPAADRSVVRINASPESVRTASDPEPEYAAPVILADGKGKEQVDFEKKLEESLKDL